MLQLMFIKHATHSAALVKLVKQVSPHTASKLKARQSVSLG